MGCEEIVNNYHQVKQGIYKRCLELGRSSDLVKLIVVTKFQSAAKIRCLLQAGQRDFAENRIEEIKSKWPDLLAEYPDVRLHFIGAIQSRKIRDIVKYTQIIHSMDRRSIVDEIDRQAQVQGKIMQCLIQVNVGDELQKSGIKVGDFGEFLRYCQGKTHLLIQGAMCIPPAEHDPAHYFKVMQELQASYDFDELSMGMSADYLTALDFGASMLRVGTVILGLRDR